MHDDHEGQRPSRVPDHPSQLPPALGPEGPSESARLIAITDEVARRLQGACRGMAPDAFDALVREIAFTKWRWDLRGRRGG